jgi:predicted phage-related endonuclease
MSTQQTNLVPEANNPNAIVIASKDVLSMVWELNHLKEQREMIELKEEKIKASIQEWMGDNATVTNEDGKTLVTYKPYNKTSFDSTKFKEEHAQLYNQYLKQTTCRPFKVA